MSAADHGAQTLAQRRPRDDSVGDSRIPHVVFLDEHGKPATAVTILSGVDAGGLRGKQQQQQQQQLHPFWLGGPSGGAPTTFVQSHQLLPATPRLDAVTVAAIAKGDGEWQYVPQCVRDTMLRLMRSQSTEAAATGAPADPSQQSSAAAAKTAPTPRGTSRRSATSTRPAAQPSTTGKSPRPGAASTATTKRSGQTPRSSQNSAAPGLSSRISFIDSEGLSRRRRSSTPQDGIPAQRHHHLRDAGRRGADDGCYDEQDDDEEGGGGSVQRKFMSPTVAKVLQRGGGQPSPRHQEQVGHIVDRPAGDRVTFRPSDAARDDDEDRRETASGARYVSGSPREDGGGRNAPFGKLESHPYDVEDEQPPPPVSARVSLEDRMEDDEGTAARQNGTVRGSAARVHRNGGPASDPFDDDDCEGVDDRHPHHDHHSQQQQRQHPQRGVPPALALQQRLPFGSVLRSPRRVSPTGRSQASVHSSRSGSAAVHLRRRNEGVGPHASEYDGAEPPGSDHMPLSARLDAAHASRSSNGNPAATLQQVRSLAASNLLTFHFGVERMKADFERFLEAQLFTAMQHDPRATGHRAATGLTTTSTATAARSSGGDRDVLAPSILESEQLQALEDVVAQTKRLHEASVELVSVFLSHEEKRYLGLHSHKFQSRRERATSYQYTSGVRKSPTAIRAPPQVDAAELSSKQQQQRPPPPPPSPPRRKAVPVSAAVSLSAITARFGSAVDAGDTTLRERLVVTQGVREGKCSTGSATYAPPQAGVTAAPVSPCRETTPTSPSALPPPPRPPSRHRTSSPTRADPPLIPLTRLGSNMSSGCETSPNASVSARVVAPISTAVTTAEGVGSEPPRQLAARDAEAAGGRKTREQFASSQGTAAAVVGSGSGSTAARSKRTAATGKPETPIVVATAVQPRPTAQSTRSDATAAAPTTGDAASGREQTDSSATGSAPHAPVGASSSSRTTASPAPRSPTLPTTRVRADEEERPQRQAPAQQREAPPPPASVVVATASFAALLAPASSSRSASSTTQGTAPSPPLVPAAAAASGAPAAAAPSFQNRPQPRQPSPAAIDPAAARFGSSSSIAVSASQSASQARSISTASLQPLPQSSTQFLPSQPFSSRGHASVGNAAHLPPGAIPLWVTPAAPAVSMATAAVTSAGGAAASSSGTESRSALEVPMQPVPGGGSPDPSPSGQSANGGGKRIINLEHLRVVDSDEDSDDT